MNVLGGAGLRHYKSESDSSSSSGGPSKNIPSWAVDWRVFNGNIYSWQNLSRVVDVTDIEGLRVRNERGEKPDPTSREVRIPGVALGRIRVVQTKGLCERNAFLGYGTASYLLRDMPGMKTGDWLRTTKIDEDTTKDVVDRGKDGSEIVHFQYGLRPVEGAAEPRFQLVGRTIGFQQVQPEEAPKEVTGRRGMVN
ncbi:hypothetical protein CCMSSC00406_0004374 [Pleurotus cornucopiae]|uniref:Uncharacterized protein n=1 Tax=Pleurotus cornucopiae TaxID=5321 RepID=A0ACB7J1X3_PLECO|nr:hypothetical protein CCMSSC00406_0004374 [Pleurotus cornucopiae]